MGGPPRRCPPAPTAGCLGPGSPAAPAQRRGCSGGTQAASSKSKGKAPTAKDPAALPAIPPPEDKSKTKPTWATPVTPQLALTLPGTANQDPKAYQAVPTGHPPSPKRARRMPGSFRHPLFLGYGNLPRPHTISVTVFCSQHLPHQSAFCVPLVSGGHTAYLFITK